ncbi:MAG: alpha/beta hydrolase [Flavobacteriaceae bacterium]
MLKRLVRCIFFIPLLTLSQETISEEIDIFNGDIHIPGTLTYSKSHEKIPLAIFVHGSGNIDRNGNQQPYIKANYIAQLADNLTASGIGFYRYDKRTSLPENLTRIKNVRINDFVSDVKLVIDKFKNDIRFSSIHLIGHSQGSLVAMLSITNNVTSYISIAGPSETIDKTIVSQISNQMEELGKVAQLHIEELMSNDTIVQVNPMLLQVFAPQNQKFLKSWMLINPSEEIKKIEIPILIIAGENDLQVPLLHAKALKKAKPDASMVTIPEMNHVLKTVKTKDLNQKSYLSPDFALSQELVLSISEFILNHYE